MAPVTVALGGITALDIPCRRDGASPGKCQARAADWPMPRKANRC